MGAPAAHRPDVARLAAQGCGQKWRFVIMIVKEKRDSAESVQLQIVWPMGAALECRRHLRKIVQGLGIRGKEFDDIVRRLRDPDEAAGFRALAEDNEARQKILLQNTKKWC